MFRFEFSLPSRQKEDSAGEDLLWFSSQSTFWSENEKRWFFHEFSCNFIALKKYVQLSSENVHKSTTQQINGPFFAAALTIIFIVDKYQHPRQRLDNWCSPRSLRGHRSTNFSMECEHEIAIILFLLGIFIHC